MENFSIIKTVLAKLTKLSEDKKFFIDQNLKNDKLTVVVKIIKQIRRFLLAVSGSIKYICAKKKEREISCF